MDFVSRTARVHACSHGALDLHLDALDCTGCCSAAVCAAGRPDSRLQNIAVDFQVEPGASLALRIDAELLARVSLLCYLLPASLMLAAAALAGWITGFANDGFAIIGAVTGLVLSGVLLRLYDSRHGFRLWQVEPHRQESGAGVG